VIGVETHVCVLQSCLDLLEMGLTPFLPVDAVGSRRMVDHDVALRRLEAAGTVLTTVESTLLELVGSAEERFFKTLLPVIKPL
jgi:nicotinamidase-related amidase